MTHVIINSAVNSARWLSLEDFEGEIWKDIPQYKGMYKASNYGRIKSLKRTVSYRLRNGKIDLRIIREKIVKSYIDKRGYVCAYTKDGSKYAHILVASAFIPNPYKKKTVDHINTICSDNRVENLRWATYQENLENPISAEKRKVSMGKPIVMLDDNGNYLEEYISTVDAAKKLSLSRSLVKNAVNYGYRAAGKRFVFKDRYMRMVNQSDHKSLTAHQAISGTKKKG